MNRLLKAVAAASVVFAGASAAQAAVFLNPQVTSADGSFTQTFGDDHVAPGSFTSVIVGIVVPKYGVANATMTTTATNKITNIDFKSGDITKGAFDQSFTFTPTVPKGAEFGSTGLFAIKPGVYTITVTGASGSAASFDGVFSFTPTPEPLTWVMTLIGVAGLGAALRAHRRAGREPQAQEALA